MSICLALEVPGKCVIEKNAFLIMHCVLRAPKLATPCHKKGRPFVRVYLQDAQKCISFPVHCASVQGMSVCVSPAHPFDCLHFDKQSHFNFRIYFWVWISQLSSAFNARACNAFLLFTCVCVCPRVLFACCIFHYAKNCIPFFCCVSFRVLFFEMHSTKLHVSLRASFVRTAGIKNQRKPTKKCIRNWGGFSGLFYISYIYLDVDAFFGNSRQYLLTWF